MSLPSTLPQPTTIDKIGRAHVKIVAYGGSGTGKTIFGAGFPPPILTLDTDNGLLSIKSAGTELVSSEQKAKIHPITIQDFAPNIREPQGFDLVEHILYAIYNDGGYMGINPVTVVLDSFTTLSQMCLSKSQFLNGHLGQQPTLPDYGGQRRFLEKIIKLGIAIQTNFVALCHEQYDKDENSGRLWLTPLIVGKLAREMPLYFDEVYHTIVSRDDTGLERYQMECTASGIVTAKSRLGLSGLQLLSYETIKPKLEVVRPKPQQGGSGENVTESSSGTVQKPPIVQQEPQGLNQLLRS